jgi:hypothetical protein
MIVSGFATGSRSKSAHDLENRGDRASEARQPLGAGRSRRLLMIVMAYVSITVPKPITIMEIRPAAGNERWLRHIGGSDVASRGGDQSFSSADSAPPATQATPCGTLAPSFHDRDGFRIN